MLPKFSRGNYKRIGIVWVILTLVFEFGMGVFSGLSPNEMLQTFDVTTGNLWSFIVVFTGFAPCLGGKLNHTIYNN